MSRILVKLLRMFPIRRRTQPPTRKEYRMMLIVLWMHPIVWLIIVYLTSVVWHGSWWYKLPVYVFLGIFPPSLEDLIMSYDKFMKEWENLYNPQELRQTGLGLEGMIFKRGVVINKCDPEGKVKIGNELWSAVTVNNTLIEVGVNVIVRDVKDMKVIVERATDSNEKNEAMGSVPDIIQGR